MKNAPIVVRAAHESDTAAMVELLNPIIADGRFTAMDELLTIAGQEEFVRTFPPEGVFHVAVCSETGRLLGMQDVLPHDLGGVGAISTFVAIDAQGRGVGHALSEATFRTAKERGFTKLLAFIRADNPGAIAFYERQGFRVVKELENHVKVRGVLVDEVMAERSV